MHITYVRLLEAARELRAWSGPAEISRNANLFGYNLSEQVLSNWKTRGVSIEGAVACARIMGARVEYILSGDLPIKDAALPAEIGKVALRAAILLNQLPIKQQIRFLHYLQVQANTPPDSST